VSARTGFPAAPGGTPLPLLPLGPDGVRRAPPRRTCPSARGQHTAPGCRLSTHGGDTWRRHVSPPFLLPKRTTPLARCQLAERVGFEPTEPFGSRALQARALDQTTQPLHAGPALRSGGNGIIACAPRLPRPEAAPLDLTRGVATCQVVSSPKCTGRVTRCRSRPPSIHPADGSNSGCSVGPAGIRPKDADGGGNMVCTGNTSREEHPASASPTITRAAQRARTSRPDRATASAA
jgi:hypothetical protein